MATQITSGNASTPPSSVGCAPYRLSVGQFLTMIDAGIFPRQARVELIGGLLLPMMVKGDPHDNSLDALSEALRRLIPPEWLHREEKSLQLGPHSRPEPDIAIVRGPRAPYFQRSPHARETALVVEVSDSSYAYDRGLKWRAYAAARIPTYWILNLPHRRVEIYSDPTGRGKLAAYRVVVTFGAGTHVPVVLDGQEVGRIAVSDLLP